MTSRLVVLALGGALALAYAASLSLPSSPPAPAAPPVAPAGDPHVRAELSDLSAEVEALWEAQAEVAAAPPAPVIEAVAADPSERAAAHHERLQATFAAEPVDRAWAAEAEDAVRGRLAEVGDEGVLVDRVECRRSLCSVALHYDPAVTEPAAVADALDAAVPWPSTVRWFVASGGDHSGWLYAAREGSALPEG